MRRGSIVEPVSGTRLDDALAVGFWAPRSYTGEDVVELHVHGGAGLAQACLQAVLTAGARLASPGEFTRRAFCNGRMDLAQAEAVADLINAETRLAARAATARLEGELGKRLKKLRDEILARLVEIEAAVDYPDEVPAPDPLALARCIIVQQSAVRELLAGSDTGKLLRDGVVCTIAGPPNAGKSSLLNALVRSERAIVSAQPGTTRDVVEERFVVDGVVINARDTAGLRATADPIEAEGVRRARAAIGDAALCICVIDGSAALDDDAMAALAVTSAGPRIVLANKSDLGRSGADALVRRHPEIERATVTSAFVCGSVRDAATIDAVRSSIAHLSWGGGLIDAGKALVVNARQIDALSRAAESLAHAHATLDDRLPFDLLSGDLRAAAAAYGEVTGDAVTDEVLDGIFARFCVGK
jgi:tRNA modification GTPase